MSKVTMEDAIAHWRLVRERFSGETPTYVDFHQTLKAFIRRETNFAALLSKVEDLFKGHDDLIVQFNRFLPGEYSNQLKKVGGSSSRKALRRKRFSPHHDHGRNQISGHQNLTCKYENQDLISDYQASAGGIPVRRLLETKSSKLRKSACQEFFRRVGRNLDNDQKNRSFVELLIEYQEHRDIDRLDKEVSSLFRENPELYVEFTAFLADAIEAKSNNEEGNLQKSIPDKDQTVNYSHVIKKNGPHEKGLFECEDATYVADLVFHGLESVKEAAERLLEEAENPNEEIDVGKFYTSSNLRFIRYLYGDTADDDDNVDSICIGKKMVELLYENPVSASLIFLSRLDKKKLDEANAWRREFRKPWTERLKSASEKARNYAPPIKKQKISSPQPAVIEAETGFSENKKRRGDEILFNIEVGMSFPESGMDAVVEPKAEETPTHSCIGINDQIISVG